MAPLRISFLIRSVYDLLPSNANLVRWRKKDDPTCPLCHGRQTSEHVLSSCKVQSSTFTRAKDLEAQQGASGTCFSNKHSKRTVQPTLATEGGAKKWCGRSNMASTHKKRAAGRLR
ncbi:reverse transcriptase [Elysia marginata]|uniref:Reverse transcriptase n=1 Tax=Elysia marginata TaxID=1093978 RepID=A0AAV4HFW0_9GAST|nr:reverse transcriptase [Elysia marginata]